MNKVLKSIEFLRDLCIILFIIRVLYLTIDPSIDTKGPIEDWSLLTW